ncbi:MAG TPA: sensor domain-containing protein [Acidimicrobiales bacterium]|nr:sensor domain-containing protein [Acidimicrobiales bacterium]
MIEHLLRPVRSASTWPALVHGMLDLPMGLAISVPVYVLFPLAVALLLTFPLALPFIWGLFWFARLAGQVERSRLAALHGVALPDPIGPLAPGSWWNRLGQRLTSVPRWKEIGYTVLRLPTGTAFFVVLTVLWSGSATLVLLPLYVLALPGEVARFGLFDVGFGVPVLGAAAVGLAGLLVVAPWATVVIGRLDVALARRLLAPDPGAELAAAAARAETGRAAAVESAESERRRIERDLHDGAQQRLVTLAMSLGDARERLDTDPETGRRLVAEAHEEAKAALKEIRDLVRGIHPVILEDRGLDAALSAVIARSPIPVELTVDVDPRPQPAVESTAYFVVSEALANVARHARATRAYVAIVRKGDRLIVEVRDDGIGGADPANGTGLAGLAERVTGMGGTTDLLSPVGGPTTLLVELPCGS